MKRLLTATIFCFALLFSYSNAVYAQYLRDAISAPESIIPDALKIEKRCPVYPETPREDIIRASWEIDARLNFLDSPSNGGYQFHLENIDVRLTHNLSNTLYAYTWVGNRVVEKIDYENSAYAKEWKTQMMFAGFGIYVTPVIKIFAGGGVIFLENKGVENIEDEPELEMPIERGIGYDIALGDNKLVLEYRFIDAKLQDEKPNVSEAPGDGSFSTVSIAYTVPL